MKRFAVGSLLFLLLSNAVPGKLVPSSCGTYRENWKEQSLLHKKALKVRKAISPKALRPELLAAASTNRDVGNIAVIDDEGNYKGGARLMLSGTLLRKLMSEGKPVPSEFSRPEVIAILKEYYDGLEEKVEVKLHGAATGAAAARR